MESSSQGVRIKKLKVVSDERGWLMEILRCDEDIFKKFGQVYLTTAYPGVVKAWHYHKKQTDNFTCLHGMMKVALYDARKDSPTYRMLWNFLSEKKIPFLSVSRLGYITGSKGLEKILHIF